MRILGLLTFTLCLAVAGSPAPQTKTSKPPAKTSPAPKKQPAKKAATSSKKSTASAKTPTTKKAVTPAKKSTASSKKPTATSSAKKAPTKKATTSSKKSTASSKKSTSRRRRASWRSGQQAPTRERYQEIQEALVSRGHLEGPPTGVWGPKSVAALKKFQASQNLEPSGKLDSLTLIALGLGPKREGNGTLPKPPPASEPKQP